MTAVKAHEVERALAARTDDVVLLLFYGPDAGLVAERARKAARGFVTEPDDALQVVRLDGEAVADQPGRLSEEATTFGLFGGRRAIWVRPTSRPIAPAVSACLEAPIADTLVVIEAGDLARTAPLRTVCETSRRALALPCYPDEPRDLGAVVVDTLREHGLSIDRDARDLLLAHLGGDRLSSRGELEKLALYAHGSSRVTGDDVEAAVTDVSGQSLDALLDAAFSGSTPTCEDALRRARELGTASGALLALTLLRAVQLLAARNQYEAGGHDMDAGLRAFRRITFRRRDALARQIRAWAPDDLTRAIAAIQGATRAGRRSPAIADLLASHALLTISRTASAFRTSGGAAAA